MLSYSSSGRLSIPDLTPSDLGMPRKYSDIRDVQREMSQFALYGPTGDPADSRRFHCLGAPPGSGKTAVKHIVGTIRRLEAQRSGIASRQSKYASLTATRSLEDQEAGDGFDLVNIRGRSNYGCLSEDATEEWNCEKGEENDCELYGTPNCTYNARYGQAKDHYSILTNYQFWMNVRRNQTALEEERGGNPITTLLCDEAHLIPSELSRHLSVTVALWDFRRYARDEFQDALRAGKGSEWGKVGEKWLVALGAALGRIVAAMAEIAEQYKTAQEAARRDSAYRKLEKLRGGLERIVRLGDDNNWIWRQEERGITFDCIWPARYAERYLWSGVPLIVLMSATLRPKGLEISGVGRDRRWFHEWPRIFPSYLSPVYWVPTGRMGVKADDGERMKNVARLDEMAELWEGRNGIVHVPSYDLAAWIKKNSKFELRMIANRREDGARGAVEAARKYRETRGAILIGPSFSTGWDFADEACEWQYIPKLPWPGKGDPVVQARCEDDPTYFNAETMGKLVQSCFRGTRHEEDECVTVIGDDAVGNFRKYAKEYAPQWFKVVERKTVPGPDFRERAA